MGEHDFKQLRNRQTSGRTGIQSEPENLPALLSLCVIEPFARITDNRVLAIILPLTEVTDIEDPAPNPGHPACAEYAGSDYCRESWQYHLAELARQPRTHWHRCDFSKLCAITPVVHQGRCLAAVKLASAGSMAEEAFQRDVEILDILVEGFVSSHSALLSRLQSIESATAETDELPPLTTTEKPARQPGHPQVLGAIEHIEKRLSDPKLSIGAIARELGIHPSYLSELFADQIGQRMSSFIAARRVELAKTLLPTINWQIELIDSEVGYANPNWFCHVFGVYAGVTPGEYRRTSRLQQNP